MSDTEIDAGNIETPSIRGKTDLQQTGRPLAAEQEIKNTVGVASRVDIVAGGKLIFTSRFQHGQLLSKARLRHAASMQVRHVPQATTLCYIGILSRNLGVTALHRVAAFFICFLQQIYKACSV